MRRAFLSLLLLATFALGLTAGAHPCQAAHETAQTQIEETSASPLPACHRMAHETQTDRVRPDGPSVSAASPSSQEERNCCQIACQHACHLVAVVSFQPVTIPAALAAQRLVTTVERGASAFAGGIDHIPIL